MNEVKLCQGDKVPSYYTDDSANELGEKYDMSSYDGKCIIGDAITEACLHGFLEACSYENRVLGLTIEQYKEFYEMQHESSFRPTKTRLYNLTEEKYLRLVEENDEKIYFITEATIKTTLIKERTEN